MVWLFFPSLVYRSPAPNEYKTDTNLLWKSKTITIKGRDKRHDSAITKDASVYNPTLGNFGTTAPKHSIGSKAAIHSGPPNSLVQAVDTPGKDNAVEIHSNILSSLHIADKQLAQNMITRGIETNFTTGGH